MSNAKPPSKTKQRARKTGPRGSRKGVPVTLWSIDPGNKSAGVCFDNYPFYGRYSYTITLRQSKKDGRCLIEVPQNGTHSSRGGVMFAAGRLYEYLARRYNKVPYVQFVEPDEWHTLAYGAPVRDGESKKRALDWCAERGIAVDSHDEAEANVLHSVADQITRTTKYAPRKRGRTARSRRRKRCT